jgi:hypothetical protein
MKNSGILKLYWKDAVKALLMVILTAFITALYNAMQIGTIEFTWIFFKPIMFTSLSAGLAYIIKNWLTNSEDQFLKPEKKK